MLRHRKYLRQQIGKARHRIIELFAQQCQHGEQTKSLNSADHVACGQFISGEAADLKQRGIHGTAAALRVLSQSKTGDAEKAVAGLVRYLHDREDLEADAAGLSKCQRDASNVIKTSEALFALSDVPSTVARADELRRRLIEALQGGVIGGKGWGYFLGERKPHPELLPTVYAVLALSHAGQDVSPQAKYLLEELTRADNGGAKASTEGADITVRIACLFVLCFRKAHAIDDVTKGALQRLLRRMWATMESLLSEDIEQNVEYFGHDRTFYVRIPWQLYLIALAARLSFFSRFGSYAAQTRLNAVLDAVERGGFRYPHSGNMISSRTNAIAFDVLGTVEYELESWRPFGPFYYFDRVRMFFDSIWCRLALGCAGLYIAARAIWEWRKDGSIGDLGPEVVGAVVLALLVSLLGKRH